MSFYFGFLSVTVQCYEFVFDVVEQSDAGPLVSSKFGEEWDIASKELVKMLNATNLLEKEDDMLVQGSTKEAFFVLIPIWKITKDTDSGFFQLTKTAIGEYPVRIVKVGVTFITIVITFFLLAWNNTYSQ